MLTLIHAANTRSTRILMLIDEMQIWDRIEIREVEVVRLDGTGRVGGDNPHPEGKVPALIHDGVVITESAAIMLYLTLLFPETGLAPKGDGPVRGDYLTWLFWYQGVMEPVMMCAAMGVSHPGLTRNFRGLAEIEHRLHQALQNGPYLCGAEFTAADLICVSSYRFFPQFVPDDALIKAWVERCAARPALDRAKAYDAALLAA